MTATYTVRDQGEELAGGGVDYDIETTADGGVVIALTSEAGGPVTVGVDPGEPFLETQWSAAVLDAIMASSTAEHHTHTFGACYVNSMGIATRRRPVRELVAEVLAGGLGHLAADHATGRIKTGVLAPPTSPSPRGGAAVEIISPTRDGVGYIRWTGTTDPGADFTAALWFKSHKWGPSELENDRIVLLDTSSNLGTKLRGFRVALDVTAGVTRLVFERYEFGNDDAQATASFGFDDVFGADNLGRWFFVGLVNNETAGTSSFYAAREGEALALRGTGASLGFPSEVQSAYVAVGGLDGESLTKRDRFIYGSVFEPQVWDDTLTLSELQALMNAPPAGNEATLAFYAPLDGIGTASLTDTVSAAVGVPAGDVREVPDLVLDLRTDPKVFRARQQRPAHTIEVEHRRNFAVLDPGNIAVAVPQDEALDLQTPARFARWSDPEIAADYLDAREVSIPALWSNAAGAQAALRLARYRYAPEREMADLMDAGRRAILLRLGDEVRVYGNRWGLEDGPAFRVIANNVRLGELTCDLTLWR